MNDSPPLGTIFSNVDVELEERIV